MPEIKGRIFKGRIAHIRDEAEFTPRNVQTRDERSRLVYGVKTAFPNPDGDFETRDDDRGAVAGPVGPTYGRHRDIRRKSEQNAQGNLCA